MINRLLHRLPVDLVGVQRAAAKQLEVMRYIRGKVRAHERALEAGAEPQDFIDAYLLEKRRVESLYPGGADRDHFFTGLPTLLPLFEKIYSIYNFIRLIWYTISSRMCDYVI